MRNLSTRYRQVHDKIKDVFVADLKDKLPKTIKDINVASLMSQMPSSFPIGKDSIKLPYKIGQKIVHYPYGDALRKRWSTKYFTIGFLLGIPLFYQTVTDKPEHDGNNQSKQQLNPAPK